MACWACHRETSQETGAFFILPSFVHAFSCVWNVLPIPDCLVNYLFFKTQLRCPLLGGAFSDFSSNPCPSSCCSTKLDQRLTSLFPETSSISLV